MHLLLQDSFCTAGQLLPVNGKMQMKSCMCFHNIGELPELL